MPALIHAASRLFHLIVHSTLHRKSRSPRQRARGLRPSCHPALRAGVLGGDGSAARERARITAPVLAAPRTPAARSSSRNALRPTHAIRAQLPAAHARQPRATRRSPRRTPRASAGGTRGEALVLSDIRTAPIGCASSPAQCPPRFTPLHASSIASRIPRSTERAGLRVREHEGFAPRATRPFGPASWAGMMGGGGCQATPSCSLTSVPRRSVALRHRRNVRADAHCIPNPTSVPSSQFSQSKIFPPLTE